MKKIISLFAALAIFSFTNAFSETSEERDAYISSEFNKITDLLTEGNIENSTILLTNPDAFIGKIFPSIPVHFAVGVTASGTFYKTSTLFDPVQNVINTMTNELKESDYGKLVSGQTPDVKIEFELPANVPLPTAGLSLRIGGIILPFDIGVYGMYVIPGTLDSFNYEDFSAGISYQTFGVDFRYCILQESGLLPKISIGAGYTFVNESFSFSAGKSFSFKYDTSKDGSAKFNTDIDIDIKQHALFAELQISKKLAYFFTPYVGARYVMAKTDEDISWKYNTSKEVSDTITTLSSATLSEVNRKGTKNDSSNFNIAEGVPQVFGGIGFNFALFQLGINAQWNPKSNYFTAGISALFKI